MNRPLRLAAAAAAVAIAVAGCSSGDGSSAAAPSVARTGAAAPATSAPAGGEGSSSGASTGSAAITIQDFTFGSPVTVAPGATVTVTNKDGAGHNLVSDDSGKFQTPTLGRGESATFTAPTAPGTYRFSCTVHANMKGIGTLTVKG